MYSLLLTGLLDPEDKGSTLLRNVENCFPNDNPAELESSATPVFDSKSPDTGGKLFQNVRNILPIDMTSSQNC